MKGAQLVITDSGGVQEETTILGVPCLTLKERSGHPETVQNGTNIVVGSDFKKVVSLANDIIADINWKKHFPEYLPKGWDGFASSRIVDILSSLRRNRYVNRSN